MGLPASHRRLGLVEAAGASMSCMVQIAALPAILCLEELEEAGSV